MTETENIKLTAFAHGAGCGCKIAPQVLQQILKGAVQQPADNKVIVGNSTNDDAAIYDLGDGKCLVATTDFFTPIVDDAFQFGQVAAANAISDVYAMGGKPIMALAILGWPVEKLSPALAAKVLDGARTICNEAGIMLAGGHTIDSTEPIFGLSVNGLMDIKHVKKNAEAREGDLLFLTKPLGTGIMSTAQKRGLLNHGDEETLLKQLRALNSVGLELSKIEEVHAMTDVTGFGLIGHLIEISDGSGLTAVLEYGKVPLMTNLQYYVDKNTVPDATYRNWNSYSSKAEFEEGIDMMQAFKVLPDPQTNGGLLLAVAPSGVSKIKELFEKSGLADFISPIGRMTARSGKSVKVQK